MEQLTVKDMALEELILDIVDRIHNLEGQLDVPPKEQCAYVHCTGLCNIMKTRWFLTGRISRERAGVLKGWFQRDAENSLLEMVPDASDIRSRSKETGLKPNEIFKFLQSRFHPAVSGFLAQLPCQTLLSSLNEIRSFFCVCPGTNCAWSDL
jgi:hypothetical protein